MKKLGKLKLEKIKLNDLTPFEQKNIVGGYDEQEIITTVTIPITWSIIMCPTIISINVCTTPEGSCLTCKPGEQDSCGLCSGYYTCPTQYPC